jgi:hypothetical protein
MQLYPYQDLLLPRIGIRAIGHICEGLCRTVLRRPILLGLLLPPAAGLYRLLKALYCGTFNALEIADRKAYKFTREFSQKKPGNARTNN